MKKKKLGLIPTLAFTAAAAIGLLTTTVNADQVRLDLFSSSNNSEAKSNIFWRRWSSDLSYPSLYTGPAGKGRYRNGVAERFIWSSPAGDRIGYCCENSVSIPDDLKGESSGSTHVTSLYNSSYSWDVYTSKYSAAAHDRINKIMYFGYEYPGHQTENFYLAAQELIWETQLAGKVPESDRDVLWVNMDYSLLPTHNKNKDYFTARVPAMSGVSERIVNSEKQIIEDLIAQYDKEVTLDKKEAYLAKTVTFTDTTGVIGNYDIVDSAGLNARIEGNQLIIENPTVAGNFSVKLKYRDYAKVSNNEPVLLTTSQANQMLGIAGSMGKTATLDFKLLGGKISISKADAAKTLVQGNASFEGAEYAIYDENGTFIETIATSKKGKATSNWLNFGTYYLQETKAPDGYKIDTNRYKVELQPTGNTNQPVEVTVDIGEEVKRGKIEITKYDNNLDGTIKGAAEGAEVMLVLTDKDGRPKLKDGTTIDRDSIYDIDFSTLQYTITSVIDEYGNASFIDETNAQYFNDYENTIPFGDYIIIETKASDAGEGFYLFFKDEKVYHVGKEETEDPTYETRIYHDHPIPVELSVVKIDARTGKEVQVAGAGFKLWDVQNHKFISQFSSTDNQNIDRFETNASGKLTLPDIIAAGIYRLYEVDAPKGYELNAEYALPDTTGKTQAEINQILDSNGKELVINDEALGISHKDKAVSTYKDLKFVYKCDAADKPIKAEIDVDKYGLLLVDAVQKNVESLDGETNYKTMVPSYKEVGLKGVKFEVYAKETIRSVDGQSIYHNAGEKVGTIITNEDGYGITTEEFYLGKVDNAENYAELNGKDFGGVFEIREVTVPYGYQKLENIPDIIITNSDVVNFKASVNRKYHNDKLEAGLEFVKKFEKDKYNMIDDNIEKAVEFGIYTDHDITDYTGKVVIKKDSLIDVVQCKTTKLEEKLVNNVDLPEGAYYYKELYVTSPFLKNTDKNNFNVKYDTSKPKTMALGKTIVDDYEHVAAIDMLKISSSSQKEPVVYGNNIENTKIDKEVQGLMSELNSSVTIEEALKTLDTHNVIRLKGAQFGLYKDKACKYPLKKLNEKGEYEPVIVETDAKGVAELEKLPFGNYYIKEVKAPAGYKTSNAIGEISLTIDTNPSRAFVILADDVEVGKLITKTDIYTGEPIANCEFKIAVKESGQVIMHAKTDEKGFAGILPDIFKEGVEYTFTEIYAPGIYDLDTRPHTFKAHFNDKGEWDVPAQDVSNVRKISKVKLIKTDEEGNRVPNCEFELRCDEIGFLVHGVTDKDGIYVFEEVPYGNYTYTEISAPAEYNIDTTPHELVVDKPYIEITFVNTGDIAVYALSAAALVSVAGLAFVAKRKLVK